jgi:hypothetical protein
MNATLGRNSLRSLLVVLAGLLACSATANAQSGGSRDDDYRLPWWLSVGAGGADVRTLSPAPSAGRNALAASIDFGYRFTPQWGLGFEFGAVVPTSGCPDWECASSVAEFAPSFTRMFAFGEYRPRNSGLRFRAGAGVSRFCHHRYWSTSAWSWGDTVDVMLSGLLDVGPEYETFGGSGAWRCDARMNALGGSVSMGYDWPVAEGSPVSMGVRLSAEAANFDATPSIGLPAFRHRALMLTLHLNIN